MTDLILSHGWGLDASLWDGLFDDFTDLRIHRIDFGFTGNPVNTQNLPSNAICVGHSLGIPFLLENAPQPRALLSIGGFDSFTSFTPPSQIHGMQRMLTANPNALLSGFYKACGLPAPTQNWNPSRLAWGLNYLLKSNPTAKIPGPIHALAAKDDPIVPLSASQSIWANHTLKILPSGNHILPKTQPAACRQALEELIHAL